MHFEIWHLILALATLIGSGVAAWVTIQRHVAALTQRIVSLEKAVHTDVKDRITEVSKSTNDRIKSVEERCDRQDARANTFVDEEEFRAYTGQTTSAVSKLTEMVGHLRGLLDGWGRGSR